MIFRIKGHESEKRGQTGTVLPHTKLKQQIASHFHRHETTHSLINVIQNELFFLIFL